MVHPSLRRKLSSPGKSCLPYLLRHDFPPARLCLPFQEPLPDPADHHIGVVDAQGTGPVVPLRGGWRGLGKDECKCLPAPINPPIPQRPLQERPALNEAIPSWQVIVESPRPTPPDPSVNLPARRRYLGQPLLPRLHRPGIDVAIRSMGIGPTALHILLRKRGRIYWRGG